MIDIGTAYLTAGVTISLATATFVIKWRDEHVKTKTDVSNLKRELSDHRADDKDMFQQVLDRIEQSENNIIGILREKK